MLFRKPPLIVWYHYKSLSGAYASIYVRVLAHQTYAKILETSKLGITKLNCCEINDNAVIKSSS